MTGEPLKCGYCDWETEILVSFAFNEFKFKFGKPHVVRGYGIGQQSLKASI